MFTPKFAPLGTNETSPSTGLVAWWSAQDTSVKVLLGASVAAVALGAILAFQSPPKAKATPNRLRKRKAKKNPPYAIYRTEETRQLHSHEPFDRIEDAVRHAERDAREKGGKFVVYDEGKQGYGAKGRFVAMFTPNRSVKRRAKTCQVAPSVPSCRCEPPKKYRKTGATRRSDYAFPECFMYPIHKPQYVRTAASRFGKFSDNIPTLFRGKVKKRIRQAEKKFGIGEFRRR